MISFFKKTKQGKTEANASAFPPHMGD